MGSDVRSSQRSPWRPESMTLAAAGLAGPLLAAGYLATQLRHRERRERTLSLLRSFLDEPMATTRRSAWAFMHAEGDDVRHFSYYVLHDPDYGVEDSGFAALLKVLLFQGTVQSLRTAGELDERLYQQLLEPHRQAWTTYTTRIADRSSRDTEAIKRSDSSLFTWREA